MYRKDQAIYYEDRQGISGIIRVRRFHRPDILIRQNKHEFREAELGVISGSAKTLILVDIATGTVVTAGQINTLASRAKDLKAKAWALVMSPGTELTQIAEIGANLERIDLIHNHGCQQRLQEDIRDFVNLHLDWKARPKASHELPDG